MFGCWKERKNPPNYILTLLDMDQMTYVCLCCWRSDHFFNLESISLRFIFQPCNKSRTKSYLDSCVRLQCIPGVFVFVFVSIKFFIFIQDEMNCSTLYSCLKIIGLHSIELYFPRSTWAWRCEPVPLISNDSSSRWIQAKSHFMMYLIQDEPCQLTDVVDSSDSFPISIDEMTAIFILVFLRSINPFWRS